MGPSLDVLLLSGADTIVIDLDGKTVNPEFVDPHTHILSDMGSLEAGQEVALANPGLVVAWHGDDLWLSPVSPILDLYTMITRDAFADDGAVCETVDWIEGAVTVEEGLKMMTINAACSLRQEHLVGSLVPGKLADLVVLTHDLLTIRPEGLPDIEVLATLIGGVAEFCAPAAEPWCP